MSTHLLIIGAGASRSFNEEFPTGLELINKIKGKLELKSPSLRNPENFSDDSWERRTLVSSLHDSGSDKFLSLPQETKESINDFGAKLYQNLIKHKPSSIDQFTSMIENNEIIIYSGPYALERTAELIDKTKSIISDIFKDIHEQISDYTENNYFYEILFNNIGLNNLENIKIINFNYDLCLEKTLENMLDFNTYSTVKHKREFNNYGTEIQNQLKIFLEKLKSSHFYGKINEIDFMRKREDLESQKEYSKKISQASKIYFLGFGFDRINLENLGFNLPDTLANLDKQEFYITNYKNNPKINNTILSIFKNRTNVITSSECCFKSVKEHFVF